MGYSPQDGKELDTTEATEHTYMHAPQADEDETKPQVCVCDKLPPHDLCWWIRMTVCM